MKQLSARPRAVILTIGDELLKGSTLNTNARFLGRALTDLGFCVAGQRACPDRMEAIQESLRQSFLEGDFVVATGGLGPTPDDLTRESIAAFYGVPLEFSKDQYREIKKYYVVRKRRVPAMVRKEAQFPANAEPLVNRHGIALGFTVREAGRWLVVLPGVPREQEKMFAELVVPLVHKKFPGLRPRPSLVVKTVGLSEPAVMKKIGKAIFRENFDFGIYPSPGEAALRFQTERPAIIRKLKKHLSLKLRDSIYAFEEVSLAEQVGRLLAAKRSKAAVAESCTGGALAAAMTAAAGASRYFQGGVVAYDNEIKVSQLGVRHEDLIKHGAVSSVVAMAMARGVRVRLGAAYGVSVTGIAGPDGAVPGKPVGTVYIAVADSRSAAVEVCLFTGDRAQVQAKSVSRALELLWRKLR